MLVSMVEPHLIYNKVLLCEQVLTVEDTLALTLRCLATGRSFVDIKFSALVPLRLPKQEQQKQQCQRHSALKK